MFLQVVSVFQLANEVGDVYRCISFHTKFYKRDCLASHAFSSFFLSWEFYIIQFSLASRDGYRQKIVLLFFLMIKFGIKAGNSPCVQDKNPLRL